MSRQPLEAASGVSSGGPYTNVVINGYDQSSLTDLTNPVPHEHDTTYNTRRRTNDDGSTFRDARQQIFAGYGFDPFFDPFYANYASFGNHNDYQQPAQPNVVVMMPQVQMPPPPVIMPPIRPEIRDYNWPVSSPDSAAAFTLVRKDQRVDSAIAVTVEGNIIHMSLPTAFTGR